MIQLITESQSTKEVLNLPDSTGHLDQSAWRGIMNREKAEPKRRLVAEPTMPIYEDNPKHGAQPRGTSKGVSSKAPVDGQAALDGSVQVKPTSSRRVGVDKTNGEIVVLDEHLPGRFHGHVRNWDELTPQMKEALTKAGWTSKQGKII